MCGKIASIIFFAILPAAAATDCTQNSDCLTDASTCISGTCKFYGCTTTADCTSRGPKSATYTCDTTTNSCSFDDCNCNTKCTDDYYGKLMGAGLASLFLGITFTVVASVPCCCGVDCGNPMMPKIIGGVSAGAGIFIIFIPMMGAAGAADGATKDVCKECSQGCTDEQRKAIKDTLNALGIIVAYTLGCGFWACIFGPIAAGIGCGDICQCCGPLSRKKEAEQQPMQAAVVGQPAQGTE